MPAQSSQTRGRGFTPLFRGLYSDQHLRVSDAERQAAADRLAQHFSEGRLDQAEFDERVGRAMNARTRADLGGLFHDLPDTGAPAVPERPGLPPAGRRRGGHPVLLAVLLVAAVVAAAHALWWATVPLLWLAVTVVAVLLATGHLGRRSHPGHDR